MTYFHSIFYGISPVRLPSYLSYFNGSNLRYYHLDNFSVESSIHPNIPHNLEAETTHTGISKSFFYRAHAAWHKLPLEIRKIDLPIPFKKALTDHLWKEAYSLVTLPSDLVNELDE